MTTLRDVKQKYDAIKATLTERSRRLWAGAEANALGRGGVTLVARATNLAISTVSLGRREVLNPHGEEVVNDRRPGGGRPLITKRYPQLPERLESLVSASVRGDPESPLQWTLKSVRQLAAELAKQDIKVSAQKVSELLHDLGFSLQGNSRVKEGERHPDREAQFQHINERTKELLAQQQPVISVDAKKKENVGEYARPGREWAKKGRPIEVSTYEFLERGDSQVIPYGIYDLGVNRGFVNVGTDHDTPVFAVASIRRWWALVGKESYPNAKRLFITADSGGSNSAASRVWKSELQDFADSSGLVVEVSHFPSGTSKWNKVEHRLFSFISLNWRGHPLYDLQTVISLIEGTKTSKGLRVRAALDTARYPTGVRVAQHDYDMLALKRDEAMGRWNYSLQPRTTEQLRQTREARPKKLSAADKWNPIIDRQIASGLNCRAFCTKEGINYEAFIWIRRKLRGVLSPEKSRARRHSAIEIQHKRQSSR